MGGLAGNTSGPPWLIAALHSGARRQLRAWHCRERLTVATELATALHHNAQRPRLVVEVPREGWRSSRTERHGTRSPKPQARDWLP